MADPTKKKTESKATPELGVENEIRVRAYQLYESRGREDGHDVDDWLKAEEELLQKTRGVAA